MRFLSGHASFIVFLQGLDFEDLILEFRLIGSWFHECILKLAVLKRKIKEIPDSEQEVRFVNPTNT